MNNYKFYDFINLYNILITNLSKQDNFYDINIYYLNNNLNLKIKNKKEIVFNYKLDITLEEYNYLTSFIGYQFIDNHEITLPYFANMNLEDISLYYQNNKFLQEPFEFENAKIHVLRNNKFEIKFYYFLGLNDLSLKMQDKALEKLNLKNKIKS